MPPERWHNLVLLAKKRQSDCSNVGAEAVPLLRYLPPVLLAVGAGSFLGDTILFCRICHQLLILGSRGHDGQYVRPHAGNGWQTAERVCGMAVRIEHSEVPRKVIV